MYKTTSNRSSGRKILVWKGLIELSIDELGIHEQRKSKKWFWSTEERVKRIYSVIYRWKLKVITFVKENSKDFSLFLFFFSSF